MEKGLGSIQQALESAKAEGPPPPWKWVAGELKWAKCGVAPEPQPQLPWLQATTGLLAPPAPLAPAPPQSVFWSAAVLAADAVATKRDAAKWVAKGKEMGMTAGASAKKVWGRIAGNKPFVGGSSANPKPAKKEAVWGPVVPPELADLPQMPCYPLL